MTREEYDVLSADIRRQIKKLRKRQQYLDKKFISELPVKVGDEVKVDFAPAIIDGIRISPTPPYKLVGLFRYKNNPQYRFERDFNNPYIDFGTKTI